MSARLVELLEGHHRNGNFAVGIETDSDDEAERGGKPYAFRQGCKRGVCIFSPQIRRGSHLVIKKAALKAKRSCAENWFVVKQH